MYERDYVEMHQFQQFALDNDISVVLVYHGKKAEERDPYKQASGSMGMTAATDGYLLLKRLDRTNKEGTLYVSGRDMDTRKVKMRMTDDALWEMAEEVEYEANDCGHYIRAIVLYLTWLKRAWMRIQFIFLDIKGEKHHPKIPDYMI